MNSCIGYFLYSFLGHFWRLAKFYFVRLLKGTSDILQSGPTLAPVSGSK